MKAPQTPEEWQEAVNLANFLLHLESARLYGLVQGGPHVRQARCQAILILGAKRGFMPEPGSLELLARQCYREAT